MASKYILTVKDGAIHKWPIRKPAAPRKSIGAWLGNVGAAARTAGAKCYAFRLGGMWRLYSVSSGTASVREFDTEDGIAMYMIARGIT